MWVFVTAFWLLYVRKSNHPNQNKKKTKGAQRRPCPYALKNTHAESGAGPQTSGHRLEGDFLLRVRTKSFLHWWWFLFKCNARLECFLWRVFPRERNFEHRALLLCLFRYLRVGPNVSLLMLLLLPLLGLQPSKQPTTRSRRAVVTARWRCY